MRTIDEIAEAYKGEAGREYHARVHSKDERVYRVVALSRVRKLSPFVKKSDAVLEYGVGLGVNLMFLDCERKVGYDPSDYGADICKRHGIAFTTDLSSVKEETFSVVICHHVLEHVSEPTKCLQDVWRILAPGGTLIACVPFETQRGYRHYDPLDPNHHLYSWNVQTLTNLVSAMGFTVLQAKLSPFGYEQRLAFIGHHSFSAYCLALWCVRKLRPVYEILLIAERPDHGTTFQSGKNRNVG